MTLVYFWFNVVAYVVFALWCTIRPEQTARFLGFSLDGWKGQAEYVAVYGGIEAAFAVFFALCALRPAWHGPGLAFATLAGSPRRSTSAKRGEPTLVPASA